MNYAWFFCLFLAGCRSTVTPVQDSDYERRFGHGSVLGDQGLTFGSISKDKEDPTLKVNRYLWHATLDRLKALPLACTDGMGGVIITDWYEAKPGERFKATVHIYGSEIKANAFRVTLHKQIYRQGQWTHDVCDPFMITNLEDAILRQARLFQNYDKNA